MAAKHYEGTGRFNLRAFWAEYKNVLPIHYRTYLAEVACKKAASANVETVFSGAGKFMAEVHAPSLPLPFCCSPCLPLPFGCHPQHRLLLGRQAPHAGAPLLSRIVKLHYNWKYPFLRPSIKEIVERYNIKFRPTKASSEAAGPST